MQRTPLGWASQQGFAQANYTSTTGSGLPMLQQGVQQPSGRVERENLAKDVPLPKVTMIEVPFFQPLPDKQRKSVLSGLQRTHSCLRQLGLPLHRVHTHRGKEFLGPRSPIKSWLQYHGVMATVLCPSSAVNGGHLVRAHTGAFVHTDSGRNLRVRSLSTTYPCYWQEAGPPSCSLKRSGP